MHHAAQPGADQGFHPATFNAAAGHFDLVPFSFWDWLGGRTVELMGLRPGDTVLDVCCGSGASLLPAEQAVGGSGRVVGVDFAEKLLDLGRAKAAARGLGNVEFLAADITTLDLGDACLDAVVCVLGIFFAPNMDAVMADLWRTVKRGGALTITTWGSQVFDPLDGIYWDAVEAERPDLRPRAFPWARIGSEQGLRRFFVDAGAPPPDIAHVRQVLPDGGRAVLGDGARVGLPDPLDVKGPDAAERVRSAFLDRIARERVTEVACGLMVARATKA